VKLLQVRDLQVLLPVSPQGSTTGRIARAVQGVSLDITDGETLGIVGESRSGKSSIARAILGTVRPAAGRIRFLGQDLLQTRSTALRNVRRQLQFLLPDSAHSLDPRQTVAQIIAQSLPNLGPKQEPTRRRRQIIDSLESVGLDPGLASSLPSQLTPAQRLLVALGRALAANPRLIVCDDPVAGLDSTAQAIVINLLWKLQERGLSLLFLSRDLPIVQHLSNRIHVLYAGKIVESGPTLQVTRFPRHPYAQALISVLPSLDPAPSRPRIILPPELHSPMRPRAGCPFHPRCPVAEPRCLAELPILREIVADQQVACHVAR
jgi:oligopeptide/dipeptide ABC transporter ATP-binding protein